jgi:hypothetical protein
LYVVEKEDFPLGVDTDEFVVRALNHLARSFQQCRDTQTMDAFSLAMQVNSVVSVYYLGGEFMRNILSGHKIPHLLWTLKFQYIIHDNLKLLLILRQIKLVHSLISSSSDPF